MIYAKSVMALDGNDRLTGARTAKQYPYDRYTCHLSDTLTDNGRQHCTYVRPEPNEARHTRQLKCYVPHTRPLLYRDGWHCSGCDSNYHGERYCLSCRTGKYSLARSDAENRTAQVAACAC